jgi:peptide/nickel transport system permease protein
MLVSVLSDIGRASKENLRLLAQNRAGFVGFLMVCTFVLVSFVGPLVVPEPHADQAEGQGPSWEHPLGMNSEGKDNLVLLIYGGKEVITVASIAGILTTIIAIVIGSVSAFLGGILDRLIMEVINAWLIVPKLPLLIIVAGATSFNNVLFLTGIMALLNWPGLARQVRAQVLSLKERDYVESAILLDMGIPYIVFWEILPNMASFVFISMVFSMTHAIYQQTTLTLVGLMPLSSYSWGNMLGLAFRRGEIYGWQFVWSVWSPAAAISLFQLSLVLMTRSLEVFSDPRLRAGE